MCSVLHTRGERSRRPKPRARTLNECRERTREMHIIFTGILRTRYVRPGFELYVQLAVSQLLVFTIIPTLSLGANEPYRHRLADSTNAIHHPEVGDLGE